MWTLLSLLFFSFGRSLRSRAALQAEILALRHQLLVLERSHGGRRLRLQNADRILWVWLSRLWQGWHSAIRIVKPDTVIAWSRKGFRLYWRWKSRARQGRPCTAREVRDLIRRMSLANPGWGAPRIQSFSILAKGAAQVSMWLVCHGPGIRRPDLICSPRLRT